MKGSRQVDHSIYSLFIARKTNLPASLSRHIYVTLSAVNAYVKCIAWSVPSPKSSSSYRPKRMQQPGYNIFPTWRQMCEEELHLKEVLIMENHKAKLKHLLEDALVWLFLSYFIS